jgi:hypothetical protein
MQIAEDFYDEGPGKTIIHCERIPVAKTTAKGVWLYSVSRNFGRFVLKDARKRYACPNKTEALISFLARKTRQRGLLTAQLRNVNVAIELAKVEKTDD